MNKKSTSKQKITCGCRILYKLHSGCLPFVEWYDMNGMVVVLNGVFGIEGDEEEIITMLFASTFNQGRNFSLESTHFSIIKQAYCGKS